ncbi:hypothetical protein NP233_g5351 [Leucocoprinus birnbaumii]|uniref:Dienelactone hydrolase domain-containing protein n=1 Tax=Leucocoprinus birnbaumii TaxID=56174 RepID=A0AAD5VUF7_9AGAR|nr:hypothetical protein NP233_g5351 [Leucocoprinus birnbaumii]
MLCILLQQQKRVPTVTPDEVTVISGYLNGDALHSDAFNDLNFKLTNWFPNHTQGKARPMLLGRVYTWISVHGDLSDPKVKVGKKGLLLSGLFNMFDYMAIANVGVRHEGVPEGKETQINGVDVYIATPTLNYAKDQAILYLPDAFGHLLINAQLLADDFARNGFYPNFKIPDWLAKHTQEKTRPILDKVINGLKDQGIKDFGAIGYCFGGRYVFDLAFENIIKASVVCHPSLLEIPADLNTYFERSESPLLINSCTFDSQFPQDQLKKLTKS